MVASASCGHVSFLAPPMATAATTACMLSVNGAQQSFELQYAASATPKLTAVQLVDEAAGSYIGQAGSEEPVPLVSSAQAAELLVLGSGFGNSSAELEVCPCLALTRVSGQRSVGAPANA